MRILLVAAVFLVFALGAAAATDPATTYAQALLKARTQTSVHYVSTSAIGGDRERMVGDAARDRGVQRIAYTHAGRTGNVEVRVVANTAYVRGEAPVLQSFLGLTPAQAQRLGGKWFFLKPPSGAYAAVAEAVRLDSWVAELAMPAPYTAVAHGVRSRTTRSGKTATITLYVDAKSLPAKQVATGPTGTITTVIGRWNAKVSVAAPPGAVAFR
jgi:hypothetical protein